MSDKMREAVAKAAVPFEYPVIQKMILAGIEAHAAESEPNYEAAKKTCDSLGMVPVTYLGLSSCLGILDSPAPSGAESTESEKPIGADPAFPEPDVSPIILSDTGVLSAGEQTYFRSGLVVSKEEAEKLRADLAAAKAEIERLKVAYEQAEKDFRCIHCGYTFGPKPMPLKALRALAVKHLSSCTKNQVVRERDADLAAAKAEIERLKEDARAYMCKAADARAERDANLTRADKMAAELLDRAAWVVRAEKAEKDAAQRRVERDNADRQIAVLEDERDAAFARADKAEIAARENHEIAVRNARCVDAERAKGTELLCNMDKLRNAERQRSANLEKRVDALREWIAHSFGSEERIKAVLAAYDAAAKEAQK